MIYGITRVSFLHVTVSIQMIILPLLCAVHYFSMTVVKQFLKGYKICKTSVLEIGIGFKKNETVYLWQWKLLYNLQLFVTHLINLLVLVYWFQSIQVIHFYVILHNILIYCIFILFRVINLFS